MKIFPAHRKNGLTLVEVVIAAAIILAAVVTLLGVHTLYLKTALSNGNSVKAAYLAEEGIEAIRFLRDSSWSANIATLSLNTDYGVVLPGDMWQATTTNTSIGDFQRTIRLSAVYRDINDDIVSSGGSLDPNTKLLVSTVSWAANGTTTSKSISTYLTNLWKN